ncbi:low temperature requirement protein A [Deinococcus sp. Arct2-2]|uniref:low temperature requirement protein A n=1 Tax=Deinococcus sp. Arct2-2 TaxID=2568653 RepID=UPI0010A37251|nr:low temperature requirement protein A [Deinococcus sp. Arct2-2]THF67741.1 low temperature requirement protein A [Deinococcus sp. Arct2-2]
MRRSPSAVNSPSSPQGLRVAQGAPGGLTRHVTWLELFFDLVFVVAVSQLGRLLLEDHSPRGVLVFLGLFVPVWWAWIGISYFIDQFELPEVPLRLLMLSQQALALGLALGLEPLTEGRQTLFVTAYLGLRLTLLGLYVRARSRVAGAELLNTKYALSFALGSGLWLVSLGVAAPSQYGLWGVALALEIAGTVWAYVSTPTLPQQVSHMPERFGLFTLIVLGESILAVATGGSHIEGSGGWVVGGCGLLLAFFVWWLSFDYADEEVIHRAIRGGGRPCTSASSTGTSTCRSSPALWPPASAWNCSLRRWDRPTSVLRPDCCCAGASRCS